MLQARGGLGVDDSGTAAEQGQKQRSQPHTRKDHAPAPPWRDHPPRLGAVAIDGDSSGAGEAAGAASANYDAVVDEFGAVWTAGADHGGATPGGRGPAAASSAVQEGDGGGAKPGAPVVVRELLAAGT